MPALQPKIPRLNSSNTGTVGVGFKRTEMKKTEMTIYY